MREMFTWVPWFAELAQKIADGGEEYLNERAKRVDWGTRNPVAKAEDLDPLSFIGSVANRSRTPEGRAQAFLSLGRIFGTGRLPAADSSNAWTFPRSLHLVGDASDLDTEHREVAWQVLRQVASRSLDAATFEAALRLPNIGLPTLSNLLFLIDATTYLPVVDRYLDTYGIDAWFRSQTLSGHQALVGDVRVNFPGCELYEIEMLARLRYPAGESRDGLEVRPDRCWLVSTRLGEPGERRDHWLDDFQPNNRVRTGRNYEGLSNAARGDIVLVRCGVTEGRGIGVVLENGYERAWTQEEAIHVLWLNKKPANLKSAALAAATPSQQTGRDAFSRATPNAKALFKACAEYRPTWRLLDRITFRREVEGALQQDRTDLGKTWRLKKDGKRKADIRSVVGNEPAVSQTLDLLLKGNMPTAPTMRTQVAKRVRGLRDRHLSRFSEATRRKLEELASNCGNQPPGDEQVPEPGTLASVKGGTEAPRVRHDLNRILYGPPGTGKTYETVSHALAIVDGTGITKVSNDDKQRFRELRFKAGTDPNSPTKGRIAMVTFHQNYAYEDFVEGIRPRLVHRDQGEEIETSARIAYEMRPGVFRRICAAADAERETARTDGRKPKRFVLIIDEINRGNIPKIFGELITLIEDSRRLGEGDATTVTLPYSGDGFGVPNNLYIVGTMNTADRSIQQLDTALRRRFTFVEMMPDPDNDLISEDIDGVDCRKLLRAMNERIALLLDREHQIGHTYCLKVETLQALADTFRNRIFPLLQEYFYDDWRKIHAVLGENAFVQKRKAGEGYTKKLVTEFDLIEEEHVVYERLRNSAPEWKAAGEYRKIYEDPKQD